MYAVTLAGYGDTPAPPMPPEGTSYGDQTWNRGAVEGLAKLIEKEKLNKPVVVGHFVQGTQIALRLAIDHPEKVGGVVVMGGPAKFIAVRNGRARDFPVDTMVMFTDVFTGPRWFKHMEKKFFDDNNFMSRIYSLDSARGVALWQRPVNVPLPVMVRYSSEYFACDVKAELRKVQCPVLVLRALFNDVVLTDPVNTYVKPQFIDSWNEVPAMNKLIQVKDVAGAAAFVWKDRPDVVDAEIDRFISGY
jgi:pimeloyl-ACP methyl ester carboxylesterase